MYWPGSQLSLEGRRDAPSMLRALARDQEGTLIIMIIIIMIMIVIIIVILIMIIDIYIYIYIYVCIYI